MIQMYGSELHPYLPGMICSWRVSLVQMGCSIEIKPHNEGGDAKGPSPIALGVALKVGICRNYISAHVYCTVVCVWYLFDAGDEACDVLHSHRVFHCKPVTLTLHPSPVNNDPGICCQPCRPWGKEIKYVTPIKHLTQLGEKSNCSISAVTLHVSFKVGLQCLSIFIPWLFPHFVTKWD